jgi:hypothetical protein
MIWNCRQAEPAHDPCPCRPEGGNREHRWRLLGAWGGARKGTCCWCRRRGTVPVSLPCETFARGHRLSPLAAGELSCTKVLLAALHCTALHCTALLVRSVAPPREAARARPARYYLAVPRTVAARVAVVGKAGKDCHRGSRSVDMPPSPRRPHGHARATARRGFPSTT